MIPKYNPGNVAITGGTITGITGTTDGSSAAAGKVGEVITGSLASGSAVSILNATVTEITSITLTAGHWLISGVDAALLAAATVGTFESFLATASGTSSTGKTEQNTQHSRGGLTLSNNTTGGSIPCHYVNITSTTTYYLKMLLSISAGTVTGYGSLSALRIR